MPEPWFFEVLPYRPSSYPGECLSGYLLRLAEVNGFHNFWDLATDLFPTFTHTSQAGLLRWEYPVENWGRIPVRTQLSEPELRRMTVMSWLEKFRPAPVVTRPSYLSPGHFLQGMVNPHLRVCPLCLQEEAYLRLIWRLDPIQVCTHHGCHLQGQCHWCGTTLTVLGPTHRHLRCAVCDADLRTLPAVLAATDLVEAQQQRQANFQLLLDPDISLVQGQPEDLPKALGLKFRYLRLQTGQSVSSMARQMGVPDGDITALELGKHTTIPFYLIYLEALSYSWADFAALEVPQEFVQNLGQPHLLHLRLCPEPECPNHQPPPSMGVKLLADLPGDRRARFRCSACGRRFTCTYEGELTAKPRRSPLPPGRLSRGHKSAEELAHLVEMGLHGMNNLQIARELGWGQKTVSVYWEALGLEEQVHQAQARRRMEEQQERHAAIRDRVEAALHLLLCQDEEITLERVAQALGHTTGCLGNYPDLVERVRKVSQVHNDQVRKRRFEALSAQIHQVIEEARQENRTLTVREILQRTGLSYERLSRTYPALHAVVRNAVKEHQSRMRILRAETRCAQINAAAMRLVAKGSRLTQAAILREAGLHKCGVKSDAAADELLRKWVSDFAPHD
jgi:hypothetical protein